MFILAMTSTRKKKKPQVDFTYFCPTIHFIFTSEFSAGNDHQLSANCGNISHAIKYMLRARLCDCDYSQRQALCSERGDRGVNEPSPVLVVSLGYQSSIGAMMGVIMDTKLVVFFSAVAWMLTTPIDSPICSQWGCCLGRVWNLYEQKGLETLQ